jgi:hypothetical protein
LSATIPGITVEVAGGFAPFGQSAIAQGRVAGYKVQRGIAELFFELLDLVVQI